MKPSENDKPTKQNPNKIGKIFCLVPAILLGICVLSFSLMEALWTWGLPEVFTIMAVMLLFLAPLPCLVMSVVALVLAISNNSDGYKSFAITDIVASVIWLGFSALSFVRVMSI